MGDAPLCPYCQSKLVPVWCAFRSAVNCSRSKEMIELMLDSKSIADTKQLFLDRKLAETSTPEERTVYCPVGRALRPREGHYCQQCGALAVKKTVVWEGTLSPQDD